MTQWEGERWLITIFPVEKCTFSLSWAKKTGYEIRNIKFIVLYIYLDIYIYIFFLFGGGGEGWNMRNVAIPHRYQIFI